MRTYRNRFPVSIPCASMRSWVRNRFRISSPVWRSSATGDEKPLQFWQRTLSYVVRILLYLSLENVPVIHERPYSMAPRQLAGLGKRKRAQQLEAIGRLYDRYVLGPAVLPGAAGPSTGDDGAGHPLRTHWRRGHFRMQPHGPGAAQRKLIFVMPVPVRADRLEADA